MGYVYWTDEIASFIRTNPKDLYAVPEYKEIPIPHSCNVCVTDAIQNNRKRYSVTANEVLQARRDYVREQRCKNPNRAKLREYSDKECNSMKRFVECLTKLGYKF